jgi:hypothetical protein
VVVLALLFSVGDANQGDSANPTHSPSASATTKAAPLTAITVSAPPSNAATVSPCTKVLEQLPVSLGDLSARVVHPQPDSPFVVAWGDPPIVLRCGVPRPTDLKIGSDANTITADGVIFLPASRTDGQNNVFTVIDRDAYVEVTVPTSYSQPPLALIADAVAKALPAICTVEPDALPGAVQPPDSALCTHRK